MAKSFKVLFLEFGFKNIGGLTVLACLFVEFLSVGFREVLLVLLRTSIFIALVVLAVSIISMISDVANES